MSVHTSLKHTCIRKYAHLQLYTHAHTYVRTYLLIDAVSSVLYLFRSLSILSLHPLPLRSTGSSSVEKTTLSFVAINSQSSGFAGREETTSLAKIMSWPVSGHLKVGMLAAPGNPVGCTNQCMKSATDKLHPTHSYACSKMLFSAH